MVAGQFIIPGVYTTHARRARCGPSTQITRAADDISPKIATAAPFHPRHPRDIAHFIKHYDNVCRGTPRIISERRIPAKIARQSLRQCSAAMRDLHEEGRGGDDFLLKMHDTREERRRGEDRGGLTRHSFIIAAFNIARERGGAV